MVYQKIIKRGNRTYGPYLYENKRVGNKVITTYVGRVGYNEQKIRFNILPYVIGLFFILLMSFLVLFTFYPTGKVALSIEDNYERGELVKGNLKLTLKEGELLPKDSKVFASFGNQDKEFMLSGLVDLETIKGSFFAEGVELVGDGEGFGLKGKRENYPTIDFEIEVFKTLGEQEVAGGEERKNGEEQIIEESEKKSETESNVKSEEGPAAEISEESSNAHANEQQEQQEQQVQNNQQNQDNAGELTASPESSEITSTTTVATGAVISENKEESIRKISGKVSKEQDFEIELQEGESMRLAEGSVKHKDSAIGDDKVKIETAGKKVVVKTDYFLIEEGVGRDFLGENKLEIDINLSLFSINASESGIFRIEMNYEGTRIIEIEKDIEVIEEGVEEQVINETIPLLNETNITLNITKELNASIEILNETTVIANISIKTLRYKIRAGEPVRWIKNITLKEAKEIAIELPKEAENITVKKIDSRGEEREALVKASGITGNIISGRISAELELDRKRGILGLLEKIFGKLTGRVSGIDLNQTELNQTVIDIVLADNSTNYLIEYYTEAPEIYEEGMQRGKKVIVMGPDTLNYTDVLVSSKLTRKISAEDAGRIRVYWHNYDYSEKKIALKEVDEVQEIEIVKEEREIREGEKEIFVKAGNSLITGNIIDENDSSYDLDSNINKPIEEENDKSYVKQSLAFEVYDIDEDGFIDYIEWVAPHLSNQTFEIIEITKAEHLDSNRTFIEDIYEQVKARDGNWTSSIEEGHYVRITFEQNLTRDRDITIYARTGNNSNSSGSIKVYEKDLNESIADFGEILNESIYKVFLSNLSNTSEYSQNVFDLRIAGVEGTGIEFDYIVDPQQILVPANMTQNVTIGIFTENTYTFQNNSRIDDNCYIALNISGEDSCKATGTGTRDAYILWNMTLPNYTTIASINITVTMSNTANADRLNVSLWNFSAGRFRTVAGVTTPGANVNRTFNFNITSAFVSSFVSGRQVRLLASGTGGTSDNIRVVNMNVIASYAENELPIVTINHPINQTYNSFPILFNVSLNEDGTACNYTLDNGINNKSMYSSDNRNYNASNSSMADGSYKTIYYCWDLSNNLNNTADRVFSVVSTDITPPVVNLLVPANGSTINSNTTGFNATFSDDTALANATIYLWNASMNLINTTAQNINGTGNSTNISLILPYFGTFFWNYLSADSSNNRAFNGTNFTLIYLDSAPPIATISKPHNQTYGATDLPLMFNVSLSENGTVRYSLDGGVSNYTMTGDSVFFGTSFNATNNSLADGSYNFSVYANDTSGNNNFTSFITFSFNGTEIYGNGTLNESNKVYYLTSNISANGTAFVVYADNVTIDGQGNTISGNNYSNAFGINAFGVVNLTIQNLIILDFEVGVYFDHINNSAIINSDIIDADLGGIFILNSNNNVLQDLNLKKNNLSAINLISSSDNQLLNINVNSSKKNRINIFSPSSEKKSNNNLIQGYISYYSNNSYYDFNVSNSLGEVNNTILVDYEISNYTIIKPAIFTFKKSEKGQIKFLESINGSSNNLSEDIQIRDNYVFLNSNITGFNKSANVTIYNAPTFSPGLKIFRDGVLCSAPECNILEINTETRTVVFNVTSWSSYIIVGDTSYASNDSNVTQETGFAHLNISSTSPYNNSLAAYWNFDYDNRSLINYSTVYDMTHNNYDVSIAGTNISLDQNGRFGSSFTFSNTTSSCIKFGNILNITNNVSLMAWVKLPVGGANTKQIVGRGNSGGAANAQQFLLEIINLDFRFAVSNWTGGDNMGSVTTTDSAGSGGQNNTWIHVAGVWNGSATSLYLNGTMADNDAAVASFGQRLNGRLSAANAGFEIGCTVSGARPFNGSIDEVMVFNSSLNSSDILMIYQNQSHRFAANGTQEFRYINLTGNNTVNISIAFVQNMFTSNLSVQINNGAIVNFTVNASNSGNILLYNMTDNLTAANLTIYYFAGNQTNQFYTPIMGGNITLNSWLIAAAGDTTNPNISLQSPANNSAEVNGVVYFYANISDDTALNNATLWIWNASSALVGTNGTELKGTSNSSNLTLNLPYNGTFFWNYLVYDAANNSAFNASNLSVHLTTWPISGCANITSNNTIYTQTANIVPVGTMASCINITASNVTFNGNGYWIANTAFRGVGIYTGAINVTIKNANITLNSSDTLTTFGVYLNGANNSFVLNNTIKNSFYGIYLLGASMNNITSNTINSSSNIDVSYGIFLSTMAHNNTIAWNKISVDSSGSYGIRLDSTVIGNNVTHNFINVSGGAAIGLGNIAYNNNVSNNVVNVSGSSGIALGTNANNNTLSANVISSDNVGIDLNSVIGNNVTHNFINTSGTTGNNFGIDALSVENNNISNNFINTSGTSVNTGISLADSNNNTVTANIINTGGSAGSNFGIHLQSQTARVIGNNVTHNFINTSGTDSNIGIYLLGGFVWRNNVSFNFIQTSGSTTNSLTNHGINISRAANNTFSSNIINNSFGSAIKIGTANANNNTFINNSIINVNVSYFDLEIISSINRTWIVDMQVRNYSFTGLGGIVNFRNSTAGNIGEIQFLQQINGSGEMLVGNASAAIRILNNSIFVNDTIGAFGLNRTANITLYGIASFAIPSILRDGATCPSSICANFTSLFGTVSFNVTGWSNYSIGDTPGTAGISGCANITANNTVYTQTANIVPTWNFACINITASNVTFNGNGYWISNVTFNQSVVFASNHQRNITIRNANLSNNMGDGLMFRDVNFSLIVNGTFDSNNNGINIVNSLNITIMDSYARNNTSDGIEFGGTGSINNTIVNNTLIFNLRGIGLAWGSNISNNIINNNSIGISPLGDNIIEFNIINNNSDFGISFDSGSTGSDNVRNNTINANFIGVYSYRNSANGIIINNNTITLNRAAGIGFERLGGGGSANISYNIMTFNQFGINLSRSGETVNLYDNILSNNSLDGINVLGLATVGVFSNNTVNNNSRYGIYISKVGVNMTNITANLNAVGFYINSSSIITNSTARDNSQTGIYISGSYNNVSGNVLINNTVAAINLTNAQNNTIINNSEDGNGYGIGFDLISKDNQIYNFVIRNSRKDAIFINDASSGNNSFANVSLIGTNNSFYDIRFASSGVNNTRIIDSNFSNYTFTGTGGIVIFRHSSFGEVQYLTNISGSGINLTDFVKIRNNSAFVNDTVGGFGLNRTANITLYGIRRDLINPRIIKAGETCTQAMGCYNFTTLTAGTVSFNVTGFSNYSISETPAINFSVLTFANNTKITPTGGAQVNISINSTGMSEFTWHWNGTNYTFLNESLLLLLNFENLSGIGDNETMARDASRYGRNFTLNNVTYNTTNAKYGNALQFNGSTSLAENSNFPDLRGSNFTIIAWFYPLNVTAAQGIVSDGSGAGSTSYALRIFNNRLRFLTDNNTENNLDSNSTIFPNNWYHAAIVWEKNATKRIYLNGKEDNVSSGAGLVDITSDIAGLRIGRLSFSSPLYFNGTIDQVIVWNRSLSADEINQTYYSGLYRLGNTSWEFYSNKTNLTRGSYTYQGIVKDQAGTQNQTQWRTLRVNNLPTVTLVTPTIWNQTTNRTPSFTWTSNDADSDAMTYELNLTCYVTTGGGCSGKGSDERYVQAIAGTTHNLASDLQYLIDYNNYYNWSARAYDGQEYGAWTNMFGLNISALVAISLPVSTIDFGLLSQGQSKNTTTGNPGPFRIQNDGNSFANITINGTDLWLTKVNPDRFYQFRISNNSAENGSFSWSQSLVSFRNMSGPAATLLAIVELNYTDVSDSGNIDLLVETPTSESAGAKQSNVTFTASLGE